MSKLCKVCGAEMPDEARFCTECGNGEFVDAAAAAAQPQFVGGDTSSVAAGAATASPQGEGYPQYQQPYAQQPYGQQPAAQPQFVNGQQSYAQQYTPAYGAAPVSKKSKKGLWIAIIAIILVLGLAAVAAFVWPGFLKGSSSELDGEWVDENGSVMTIGDGKITMLGVEYNCKVSGGKIEISADTVVRFEIDGDTLTLTKEDAEEDENTTETYTRVGEGTGLEGEWKAPFGFTMTLRGGKVTISGFDDIEYTYSVSGDTLTLHRTETYAYTLEGDKLTFYTDDEEKEVVAEYTRKSGSGGGAIDGPGVPADLVDTWVGEYDDTLVIHVDGTGEFAGSDFTYTVDGDKIVMVRGGETYNYTFDIDGDTLYFYDEDGIISETFYRYGTTPPSGYTGTSVEDEWYFNIDNVDYNDMYDAMIGAVLDTTGANEATRSMINDQKFKDSIRDEIGDFIERYYFDFRYDGSVHEIMSPEDYRDYVVSVNEASMDYVRDFTLAEAAEFYGTTEAEIQNYLNTNNLTWAEYVDRLKEANGPALREQFTDDAIAQMMGGTVNSYGEIEMDIGTYTQDGDTVTITGPAGDVTVLKFTTDDVMEVVSITAPEGSSDAALSMLDSMNGLRFVRG